MSDAVYGLLGALGGAVVAATAAYWGPLQTQKQARLDAELQRQRAEERAQLEAHAAEKHERQRAQVARVARIRRVVGDWCHLIERALEDIKYAQVHVENFRSVTALARTSVTTEIYEAITDGINIRGAGYSAEPPWQRQGDPGRTRNIRVGRPQAARRIRTSEDQLIRVKSGDQRLILDALDQATSDLIRLTYLDRQDESWNDCYERAEASFQRAIKTRSELSQRLMRQLVDIVDMDTIDTRESP